MMMCLKINWKIVDERIGRGLIKWGKTMDTFLNVSGQGKSGGWGHTAYRLSGKNCWDLVTYFILSPAFIF